jgi:hypothetical protein
MELAYYLSCKWAIVLVAIGGADPLQSVMCVHVHNSNRFRSIVAIGP